MKLAAWKRAELRRRYANTPSNVLARELGLCLSAVYRYAGLLGLKKSKAFWSAPRPRRSWTVEQIEILKRDYPNTPTSTLARQLGHGMSSVYRYAYHLGVRKSAEFLAGPYNGRIRGGVHDGRGAAYRFKKGIVPHNKGLRRPGWYRGRMRETQFKKGQRPHTWRPIGSTRLQDGYLQEKVTDTHYTPHDWKPLHVLLWKRAGRKLPRDHVIAFKDGDRTHVALENLECIHRRELLRRNHWTRRLPKELWQVIALRSAIKRKITMRGRDEQHDRGSSKASLRNARRAQRQREAARHRARQSGLRRRRQDHRNGEGRSLVLERGGRPGIGIHPVGPTAGWLSTDGSAGDRV